MTDAKFVEYVNIHSRTDLALFHRDHVLRFAKLCGGEWFGPLRDFEPLPYDRIKDSLAKARENVKAKP